MTHWNWQSYLRHISKQLVSEIRAFRVAELECFYDSLQSVDVVSVCRREIKPWIDTHVHQQMHSIHYTQHDTVVLNYLELWPFDPKITVRYQYYSTLVVVQVLQWACLSVSISQKPQIQTTPFFVHFACGSVLLWLSCNKLCNFGFMTYFVFLSAYGPYVALWCYSSSQAAMCEWTNTPVEWYWMRPVIDKAELTRCALANQFITYKAYLCDG